MNHPAAFAAPQVPAPAAPPALGMPQQAMQMMMANPQKLQGLLYRARALKQAGATVETNPELNQIMKILSAVQTARNNNPQQPMPQELTNGFPPPPPNGVPAPPAEQLAAGHPLLSGPLPNAPSPSPSPPITFTDQQLVALRAQIQAFRLISRGLPIPEHLQNAVKAAQLAQTESAAGAAANGGLKEENVIFDVGPYLEQDRTSPIYPYNAFVNPFTYRPKDQPTGKENLMIPSIMPVGLDPHQILIERNRYVEARIENRIQELSALASSIGDGSLDPVSDELRPPPSRTAAIAHGKLRALIELKSLQLRHKQRTLRAQIAERIRHGSTLPTDRREYRRVRQPRLRDARETEALERRQREERERRSKQKHLDYLNVIFNHGRELITVNRGMVSNAQRVGRAVLKFHLDTEKEEQERIKRISKERLKALKADDEEAYLRLIDTAKDTRITHLLRQTDSYLDSLAMAVVAQQNDDIHRHPLHFEGEQPDETTFGATKMEDDEDKGKIDYYAVAHRIMEKVTAQPAMLVGGQLKEYQIKGLQWMVSLYNNRLNGILADEMGLGKTIQTISLIAFLIERKQQRGPYLVVVPLSTLTNWTLEFQKWAPALSVVAYKGTANVRKQLQNQLRPGSFQVLITTYEYIIKDRPVLSKIRWVHMIIDEGHRMKNTNSKLSQTLVQYYHSRYRLILTGTPLQNNLPELWSLLNFVLPKVFNSVKSFDEWFNTPFANTGGADKMALNEEESLLVIRRLHKVLRPFLLRRLKKDVAADLPDKIERVIKCKMSALQQRVYKQYTDHRMIFGEGKDEKGGDVGEGLHNDLMQFRKICQHPFLFAKIENALDNYCPDATNIIRTAGKFELLDRILPKLFATNHRCLIFFQMTNVMDLMDHFMTIRGWKFLRLDGTSKQENRAEDVAKFNAPNSDVQAFLLSTRAGGLGLNLQTADTVIIFDSDWNPHADLQAQDRAHRIGQTKAVRVYRLITEKSIEEAILARAREKLDMDGKVIQAGKFDNKSTPQEREEMLRSLIGGDQEDTEESGIMNDEELNEILARDDNESHLFRQMDEERDREAEQLWRAGKKAGLMTFEELPPIYQTDTPAAATKGHDAEGPTGRGHRRRAVVNYDIDLTDAQFFESIEAGIALEEEDIQPRNRRRLSPSPDADREPTPRGRKPKGKGRRVDDDYDDVMIVGKRKRGQIRTSITPSIGEEEEAREQKRRKVQPTSSNDIANGISTQTRERMKKVFAECLKAVQACEDETGRLRCALFRELPKRSDYPDYYTLIQTPIAMSHMRKRGTTSFYKSVADYRNDWRLMFDNARTYNSEGSWVYNDANEMQKVLEETFTRLTYGTDLPGADGGPGAPLPLPMQPTALQTNGGFPPASYAKDDEEEDIGSSSRRKPKRAVSRVKKVLSDDDDEYLSGGTSD